MNHYLNEDVTVSTLCLLMKMLLLSRGLCRGLRGGVPWRTEHGNRPIFSSEFGEVGHILAGFENWNTGGHGNSSFDRYATDMYFEIIGTEIRNHNP